MGILNRLICSLFLVNYLNLCTRSSALIRLSSCRSPQKINLIENKFFRSSRLIQDKTQIISKSSLQSSMISPDDAWSLWAIVAGCAATGMRLEKTAVGKALSGPVCAMLIGAILTNLNILPASGSIHITNLQSFIVRMATPLLLLGANLIQIYAVTGNLLKPFFLGTFGTMLGSFLSFSIFAGSLTDFGVGLESWKVGAAIAGKNIGGGLNYMAVSEVFQTSAQAMSTGLAVDNIMGLVYFPICSFLGRRFNKENPDLLQQLDNNKDTKSSSEEVNDVVELTEQYTGALAIGLGLVAISEYIQTKTQISSLAISTLLTVIIATGFPKQLSCYIGAGDVIGRVLLYLFFGSIGISSGKVLLALSSNGALPLLGYGLTLYLVHLTVVLTGGKLLKIPLRDTLLGSNANIGGAATASALAASMGWKDRLLPAVLLGTLGSFLATFLGIWLGASVLKPIALSRTI